MICSSPAVSVVVADGCAIFASFRTILLCSKQGNDFPILMQDDVNEACGAEDGFQPTLKPYQLIGVNFLMLLYRKKIGGGTLLY